MCGNSTDSSSCGGSSISSSIGELLTEDAVELLRLMTYNLDCIHSINWCKCIVELLLSISVLTVVSFIFFTVCILHMILNEYVLASVCLGYIIGNNNLAIAKLKPFCCALQCLCCRVSWYYSCMCQRAKILQ